MGDNTQLKLGSAPGYEEYWTAEVVCKKSMLLQLPLATFLSTYNFLQDKRQLRLHHVIRRLQKLDFQLQKVFFC